MTDDEIRAKFCLWAEEQVWLSDDEGRINLRFLGLHKQFVDMTVEHCYRAFAAGIKDAGNSAPKVCK